jgi:hypothetical protein
MDINVSNLNKMKFSVGYSLIAREHFNEAILTFRDHVAEIYFSWPGMESGRADIVKNEEDNLGKVRVLINDLSVYKEMGIPLVMLFNGNCYGGKAISVELNQKVIDTIEYIQKEVGSLYAVTTASPFIASKVKEHYSELQVRASVNMRINTTFAMEYLSDRFDFFYLAKEVNRNIEKLKELKSWADSRKKQVGILVNSGCLNNCPNQTFHDNLVAHEFEMRNFDPTYFQPVLCRRLLALRENWQYLLSKSNWVRPEDINEYQEMFQIVKLATRMHVNPFVVIGAYSRASHRGNILDLMEPGFSEILFPYIIENKQFPKEWSSGMHLKENLSSLLEKVLKKIPVN